MVKLFALMSKSVFLHSDDRNSCGVDYVLYSCGDSVVLQHNPAKLQDNALNINNIIRETNKLQVSVITFYCLPLNIISCNIIVFC